MVRSSVQEEVWCDLVPVLGQAAAGIQVRQQELHMLVVVVVVSGMNLR